MSNTFLLLGSTVVALIMATTMIFVRMKVARKPTSVKRIILPPIFMSTGALMFLSPMFRLSLFEVGEAIAVGLLFSVLLIRFTTFTVSNGEVYLIPSKAFIFILFGLLLVRIVIKLIIGSQISFGQTSGMFFLLAFAMIVSWRLAMVVKYIRLKKEIQQNQIRAEHNS